MDDVAEPEARISPAELADAILRSQTYAEYEAGMPTNRELMAENHAAVAFTPAEREAITAMRQPLIVLAIVEDWCPDVVANLPVFAKIADLNPRLELHVLFRPDHRALADAYPGPGERSHIPTYVVFSKAGEELAVLIERPPVITGKIRAYGDAAIAEKARLFPGMAREDYPEDWVRRRTRESHDFRNGFRDLERAEIVAWLADAAA